MVVPGSVPKGNIGVLRAFALGYPGAQEEYPWGERVVKVKGKVFVFLGRDDEGLGLSVKLPQSRLMALGLPFASPTAYGLGKSGWVTVQFGPREKPPAGPAEVVDRRELPRGGAEDPAEAARRRRGRDADAREEIPRCARQETGGEEADRAEEMMMRFPQRRLPQPPSPRFIRGEALQDTQPERGRKFDGAEGPRFRRGGKGPGAAETPRDDRHRAHEPPPGRAGDRVLRRVGRGRDLATSPCPPPATGTSRSRTPTRRCGPWSGRRPPGSSSSSPGTA